jgi:hypothetical protein
VRALAREKGQPEPAFVHHTDDPAEKFGDYTTAPGTARMPASKAHLVRLFRAARVATPVRYHVGLAQLDQGGTSSGPCDDQLRRASLPEQSAQRSRPPVRQPAG